MKSNGAKHADAAHTAGRNKRQAYQQAYRAYMAAGMEQKEAAAKAKAEAYPPCTDYMPAWAKK